MYSVFLIQLNWIKGMEVAIDEARNTGKIAEAAICYTGDILDDSRAKYSVQYYKDMAKELEASRCTYFSD